MTDPTKTRGFTIIELLLALALMAVIMAAAALAIHAAHASHVYNAEKTDLVARARGVLDRVARDVRQAASFVVADSRTLVVTMPDGTDHTYVWDGVQGGNLTYILTDSDVSTSTVLTNQVALFTVGDDSPACSVRIEMAGDLATSEASLTSTPRKAVY